MGGSYLSEKAAFVASALLTVSAADGSLTFEELLDWMHAFPVEEDDLRYALRELIQADAVEVLDRPSPFGDVELSYRLKETILE